MDPRRRRVVEGEQALRRDPPQAVRFPEELLRGEEKLLVNFVL